MNSKFYKVGFFALLIIFVSVALMAQGQRWPWIQGRGFAFQHGQTISSSHSDSLNVIVLSDASGFIVPRLVAERIIFVEDAERTGPGSYMHADELPIGMTTAVDCQGAQLEFCYGVTPDTTGTGRMAHGIDVKMVVEECYDFESGAHNATIRGARLQGWAHDDVSGKVMGAYINARATGKTEDSTIAIDGGLTTTGLISIEARTELGSYAECTATVVGLLVFHNNKTMADLTGDYRAIQIDQPLHGTDQMDDKFGIYFADDHGTVNCEFDYAFGFDANLDDIITSGIADYNASFTLTDTSACPDGWIKVEIDGTAQYIHTFTAEPAL